MHYYYTYKIYEIYAISFSFIHINYYKQKSKLRIFKEMSIEMDYPKLINPLSVNLVLLKNSK